MKHNIQCTSYLFLWKQLLVFYHNHTKNDLKASNCLLRTVNREKQVCQSFSNVYNQVFHLFCISPSHLKSFFFKKKIFFCPFIYCQTSITTFYSLFTSVLYLTCQLGILLLSPSKLPSCFLYICVPLALFI